MESGCFGHRARKNNGILGDFMAERTIFKLVVFVRTGFKAFVFGDEADKAQVDADGWFHVYDEQENELLGCPDGEVVAYHWNCELTKDAYWKFWNQEWVVENK